MEMVSYQKLGNELEGGRVFSGVREDDGEYGKGGELYEELLEYLRKEFFQDKYSLCLQVRGIEDDEVLYEFPRVVCPELFLEQLRIKKI